MKSLVSYINESLEKEPNMFVIIKPGFLDKENEIEQMITSEGWEILKKEQKKLDKPTVEKLYKNQKDEKFFDDLCNYMSSDDSIGYQLYKDTNNPIDGMKKIKEKVRDTYAKDEMKNGMHSSDSEQNVKREIKLYFK